MPVLAVAVSDSSFEPLLIRTYSEVSTLRVKEILEHISRQPKSAFYDVDCVRVIPVNSGDYILSVFSNTASNFVEDVRSLNLMVSYFSSRKYSQAPSLDSEALIDLMITFDEVFGIEIALCSTFENLKTILLMESKEEELQEALDKVYLR
jgi:hypothetical protein